MSSTIDKFRYSESNLLIINQAIAPADLGQPKLDFDTLLIQHSLANLYLYKHVKQTAFNLQRLDLV